MTSTTASASSKRGEVSDVCFAPSPSPLLSKTLIDLVERPFRQFNRLKDGFRNALPITAIIVVRLLNWGDVAGRDVHPK
jgi:hypothetical protein